MAEGGLAAGTPLLSRVEGVLSTVYVEDLCRYLEFGVKVEVLSLNPEDYRVKFVDVKGCESVNASTSFKVDFRGGGFRVAGDYGVYVVNSIGRIVVRNVSRLSRGDFLVSFIRMRSGDDMDRFLDPRITYSDIVPSITCWSHEWYDIVSRSQSPVLKFMKAWGGGRPKTEDPFKAKLSKVKRKPSRRVKCYENHLQAYQEAWTNRILGFPTSLVKWGSKLCVSTYYRGGRSRDLMESIPSAPLRALKSILKGSRQSAAVKYLMIHKNIHTISKRIARLIVSHLLCGGLTVGSEGPVIEALKNSILLAFGDLAVARVAEVGGAPYEGPAYRLKLGGGVGVFAGGIPVLLESSRSGL